MIAVLIVLILSVLYYFYSAYKNKVKILNINIKTIEEKLNSNILKRKELLKDSESLIKDITKTKKEIYTNFDILNEKLNIFEMDSKTLSFLNEYNMIKEKNDKLNRNSDFLKLNFTIEENEEDINAYKIYYNKNVEEYNKLVSNKKNKNLFNIKTRD